MMFKNLWVTWFRGAGQGPRGGKGRGGRTRSGRKPGGRRDFGRGWGGPSAPMEHYTEPSEQLQEREVDQDMDDANPNRRGMALMWLIPILVLLWSQ